jgi:hypothetical protein
MEGVWPPLVGLVGAQSVALLIGWPCLAFREAENVSKFKVTSHVVTVRPYRMFDIP